MAMRGVWQLQKLIVSYCDWGGSSRGVRAFIDLQLPAFKEKNTQLEVITELNRGQHPHLTAFYSKQAKEFVGKKGSKTKDNACDPASKRGRYRERVREILEATNTR